ncbi:MAG: glycosyltransferase [Prevotella sp.]|jgi:spore maturation protein CgeB|nr:glycosyltransferase [Prevotella sp.]MCI1281504.1 glycosyltransferase [Prevotella sp.]
MRILSVGTFNGLSNTCLHRHWALTKVADEIDAVDTAINPYSLKSRIIYHLFLYHIRIRMPENNDENNKIKNLIDKKRYDILWIDKGVTIFPETLIYVKKKSPNTIIISYSPDNMALRHNQSQQYIECIPWYDYIVTNKSYIINDLKHLGSQNVIFVNNAYEPTFHYPRKLSDADKSKFGSDVGFVGAFEKERLESILYLADHGIHVKVFGDRLWQKYKKYNRYLTIEDFELKTEDYCKALSAFKISLCFLRKKNYDTQTTRTVEIPACRGFLLAERTEEHKRMFREDEEAVYFSSNRELLNKCIYYLEHEAERKKIAEEGYKRCITSGYSNIEMIRKVLEKVGVISNE